MDGGDTEDSTVGTPFEMKNTLPDFSAASQNDDLVFPDSVQVSLYQNINISSNSNFKCPPFLHLRALIYQHLSPSCAHLQPFSTQR